MAIEHQLANARSQQLDAFHDDFFGADEPWAYLKHALGNPLFRRDDPHVFEVLYVHALRLGWMNETHQSFPRFLAYCHRIANDKKVRNPYGLLVSELKAFAADSRRMYASKSDFQWANDARLELARGGR